MSLANNQPPFRAQGPKMHHRLDARLAALETDVKFVCRDLHDIRSDMRDARERLDSVEVKVGILTERLDSSVANLSEKIDRSTALTLERSDTLSACLTDRSDNVRIGLTERMDTMGANLTGRMDTMGA